MFCKNCGTELKDGVAFCTNCGASLKTTEPKQDESNETQQQKEARVQPQEGTNPEQHQQMAVEPKVKKPLDKKVMIGIVAVLAVIIGFVIFKMMPKKYNIEDYVKVEFQGYNGYGKAYASLDYQKLYTDIMKDKGKDSKKDISDYDSFSELGEAFKDGLQIEEAIDSIELKLEKDYNNLSNGDEVKVLISYDEKAVKEAGIRFKGSSVSKKAEGLQSIQECDPFADLVVTFAGTAPNGYIQMDYLGTLENVSTYSFNADKYDGLRNGDVVTVTFGSEGDDPSVYGFAPTTTTKEYTVEGLDEYVSHYSDIPEDVITSWKAEAEDTIVAYAASSYDRRVKMKNLEYTGYILNTLKPDRYGDNNDLILVYKATLEHTEDEFENTEVYYPVQFREVLNQQGSFTYSSDLYICGGCYINSYYTEGYNNALSCYMELVEGRKQDYDTECGDGFTAYNSMEYIGSLEDVDAAFNDRIVEDAKETIKQMVKDSYYMKSVKDLKQAGTYLVKAKAEDASYLEKTILVVVLSGTVSPDGEQFKKSKVFYPVVFKGVVKLSDGTCAYTKNDGLRGNEEFKDSYYGSNGYISGENMYSELISANRNNYTYEVSEGLKEFGQ